MYLSEVEMHYSTQHEKDLDIERANDKLHYWADKIRTLKREVMAAETNHRLCLERRDELMKR